MWPRLIIIMQYLTKKECSSLLALLGEESLHACTLRNEPERMVRVSWVGKHIVTVEPLKELLLVRVTGVFPGCYVSLVEKAIQEAAMRESGYYCLSARELEGFALAEITIYGVPHNDHNALRNEIENMCHQLDVLCFA